MRFARRAGDGGRLGRPRVLDDVVRERVLGVGGGARQRDERAVAQRLRRARHEARAVEPRPILREVLDDVAASSVRAAVGRDAHRKVAVRDALARGGELVAAEHVLVGRERERRQPGPERAGEAQHRDRRTSAGVAQPQLDLPARHHVRVGPVLGLELGEAGHDAARAALQHELQASCR